jgi:hypothetical protein
MRYDPAWSFPGAACRGISGEKSPDSSIHPHVTMLFLKKSMLFIHMAAA